MDVSTFQMAHDTEKTMKTETHPKISPTLVGLAVAVSLICQTAHGQWYTWEVSAGGNGHKYLPVSGFTGLTWTIADSLARAKGGYLATLTSPAENAFVFSLVDAPQFWTGGNGSGPAL